MGFSARLTDDLVRVVVAGGGLRMDGSHRLTDDLVRIAVAGSGKGSKIVFYGMAARLTDDLVRIAVAGKGCVHFED